MDICMICGREYDPMMEPDHEENCQELLADEAHIEVKSDPVLTDLLEGLLNEKKEG